MPVDVSDRIVQRWKNLAELLAGTENTGVAVRLCLGVYNALDFSWNQPGMLSDIGFG